MSFITTKFHKILVSGFRRVVLTNCFSSIFHFGQISKLKKGVTPGKKIESKFPVDMGIYTLCPSLLQIFRKFCWAVSEELCWQTVLSSIFHFGQISKFKKGCNSQKKNWIKISCEYAHLHIMSWLTTKFQEILFQRSCADKYFWVVYFILAKFLFKKGVTPREKIESKFPLDNYAMRISTGNFDSIFSHYVLHNYKSFTKFCRVVSEELSWQEKQNWLTDWWTGQKHYTLRNLLRGV